MFTSASPCPEHHTLLAMVEGRLPDDLADSISQHVIACLSCDEKLEQLEERSDSLIQALSSLPPSPEDEQTFRQVHAQLLADPQPFVGHAEFELTDAYLESTPIEHSLPFTLGNYTLLEQIGVGAHGAVFRAQHRRLERDVAVKLLLHHNSMFVDEFLNEMRTVGKLDHPHIIRATDAGEHQGLYFLVMEFVAGLDVSSLLRRTGPLGVADACEIARQAGLGLACAHDHGLVHRDVKTSNLLCTSGGIIKLLDLGLATIPTARPNKSIDGNAGPRGTADYMAPEQWEASGTVGAQADLYSLGCTLFKLLTGSTPYRFLSEGQTSKEAAHRCAEIPSLSDQRKDIPHGVEQLVQRLLAKSPADRPESAREVITILERFAADANLGRLIQNHCPDLEFCPASNSLPTLGTRRWIRKIDRRLALALGAAVLTGIVAWRVPQTPNSPPIDTSTWRIMNLADPPVLPLSQPKDTKASQTNLGVEVVGDGIALIHFGSPYARPFHWRIAVDDMARCGLFFRLRLDENKKLRFQTVEWLPGDEMLPSRLIWYAYDDFGVNPPFPLAETDLSRNVNGEAMIELTLGRSGTPEVKINGHGVPVSKWTLSKEAREIATTKTDELPSYYAGRIGVLHRGGNSTIRSSELKYLTE